MLWTADRPEGLVAVTSMAWAVVDHRLWSGPLANVTVGRVESICTVEVAVCPWTPATVVL
jgi:hypothetical protein